jgi:hypothetical protein
MITSPSDSSLSTNSKAFDHVDHSIVLSKMTSARRSMCDTLEAFVLIEPQQRVKIGSTVSQWTTLTGGMLQGAWFGPYVFLMLIDVQTMMTAYKFVDDVTIGEVVNQSTSHMQLAAQQLAEWSKKNLMNINTKKTKEMMLGPALLNPPPLTVINDRTIERVASFELLEVTIANNLNWDEHITTICNKANKRLYYLKLLKQCLVSA